MKELFELAAVAVEVAAVLVLIVGLMFSAVRFLSRAIRGSGLSAYHAFRQELGRNLLLTLEILIGADIIWTVAVEQTFVSLGMLGLLVLIRTFLSFALTLELTGRWPWQGGQEAFTGD
jgi:uncharacterized membrane protein